MAVARLAADILEEAREIERQQHSLSSPKAKVPGKDATTTAREAYYWVIAQFQALNAYFARLEIELLVLARSGEALAAWREEGYPAAAATHTALTVYVQEIPQGTEGVAADRRIRYVAKDEHTLAAEPQSDRFRGLTLVDAEDCRFSTPAECVANGNEEKSLFALRNARGDLVANVARRDGQQVKGDEGDTLSVRRYAVELAAETMSQPLIREQLTWADLKHCYIEAYSYAAEYSGQEPFGRDIGLRIADPKAERFLDAACRAKGSEARNSDPVWAAAAPQVSYEIRDPDLDFEPRDHEFHSVVCRPTCDVGWPDLSATEPEFGGSEFLRDVREGKRYGWTCDIEEPSLRPQDLLYAYVQLPYDGCVPLKRVRAALRSGVALSKR